MFRLLLALVVLVAAPPALAGLGVDTIEPGAITIFYPSPDPERMVEQGSYRISLAPKGMVAAGNGRLVVFSHGSGGSPWPLSDLARQLVADGFVVAVPEHEGDNWRDLSKVGPPSWKQRPAEITAAIDRVLADRRFAGRLAADRVGLYGMSAGGHTVLAMSGGRWSPARLAEHCKRHIRDDFNTCAGPVTRLRGDMFDSIKIAGVQVAQAVFLNDTADYGARDVRIRAAVAEVPFAADFNMASLATPDIALGLVRAGRDIWLVPQFHIDQVRAACRSCEMVADLPAAGHGSLLSPQPTALTGTVAELLSDPSGFDRRLVADAHRRIAAFFRRKLLD